MTFRLTETEIQNGLVEAAKIAGFLYFHTHDSRRSAPGFPDLVLVHARRGQVFFIEVKGKNGRVSDAQYEWLDALNEVEARVVDLPPPSCPVRAGIANPETYDLWLRRIMTAAAA